MTRATLLHVLDQPTALGPAEVRELEQLAQAFPYCQTAHLLLAKAAHDQGTMLAGQRLRRAATYAADRTLLRRLIEQVEPTSQPLLLEVPAEVPVVEVPAQEPVAPVAVVAPEPSYTPVVTPQSEPIAQAAVVAEVAPVPAPAPTQALISEPMLSAEPVAELVPEPEQPKTVVVPEPVAEPETVIPEVAAAEPIVAFTAPTAGGAEAEAITEAAEPEQVEMPAPVAEHVAFPEPAEAAIAPLIPTQVEAIVEVSPSAEPEIEPDLPPQAPAIRPPVEVGEARFEFGLAEPPAPAAPAYELPGLVDEWAASAVTRSLGTPESLPALFAAPAATPAEPTLTPAAFTGDETLGYGFGESSRLGFSLQLLNILTDKAEAENSVVHLEAMAQPPAAPLPPTGAFFEPDPLLHDHWQQHAPPPVLQPSSLDLINNFLRRQPRLTRPAMLPPSPTSQTDLSVRSTRVEPDLVSESLARILVRQGKTARAIEIYEKLMVKQPEKMAYFAAQIQSLQPPA